jgi:predicted nucleic acid-binding Zn ribbon protein
MRRSNTRPIGEVLGEYVEAFKLKGKLNEIALIKSWPELVGENIARHTIDIKIQNKILYIKIQSSIIRQELMMIRTELVKRMNEKAGETVINEMVLY